MTQLTPTQKKIVAYLKDNPDSFIEHMKIYASVIDGDYITLRDKDRNSVQKIQSRTFSKLRDVLKQEGTTDRSIGITIRIYKLATQE